MRVKWWVPFGFLLPAFAGLIVFRVVPIWLAAVGSVYETTIRGDTVFRGLANYSDLWADEGFWQSVKITLIFNLIINPFQVGCAMVLALLVQRPTRFIAAFRVGFLLPMTISVAITFVIWAILLDQQLGPVNGFLRWLGVPSQPFFRSDQQALATIIGVATWKGAGYWMLFLLAGLLTIPGEIYEAAQLDGANPLQRFFYVTLPLMRRPLAFVLVADTAINFLMFAPAYIVTGGGPNGATRLLMYEAYQAAFSYLNQGRSLAISVVILAIILVIATAELRLFRSQGEAA